MKTRCHTDRNERGGGGGGLPDAVVITLVTLIPDGCCTIKQIKDYSHGTLGELAHQESCLSTGVHRKSGISAS